VTKNARTGALKVPVILNRVKDLSIVSCDDHRLPGDCCGRRSFASLRMTMLFHAALVPGPGMPAQDDDIVFMPRWCRTAGRADLVDVR
jgi:hypothetical protein